MNSRPNILVIQADQMTALCLSAYGKPYAVVEDRSIIPFALQSKRKPENRVELAGLFKKPSFATATKKSISRPQRVLLSRLNRVRTTAYTHNESDHLKYGRKTALGTRLRFGKVRSAADVSAADRIFRSEKAIRYHRCLGCYPRCMSGQ